MKDILEIEAERTKRTGLRCDVINKHLESCLVVFTIITIVILLGGIGLGGCAIENHYRAKWGQRPTNTGPLHDSVINRQTN